MEGLFLAFIPTTIQEVFLGPLEMYLLQLGPLKIKKSLKGLKKNQCHLAKQRGLKVNRLNICAENFFHSIY